MLGLRNAMIADLFAPFESAGARNTETWKWQAFSPAADVRETEGAYLIELDVPGMSDKDIEVVLESQHLTLRGERKQSENANYTRSERAWGQFERVFHLPEDADTARIDASARNGVLTIEIPKAESARRKTIAVRAAE